VIAKPTTEQILLDCSRELMEVVLPAVSDETAQVAVFMLDLVLRNSAVRAAHEIAWMGEEIEELSAFAGAVLAAIPDAPALREALEGELSKPIVSLHLDDVVERYRQASEASSRAIEAAVGAGKAELVRRGAELMERRVEHEQVVMSGWSPVGR